MDADKIKQLMELAANVYGTGFWKDIFDPSTMNPFMGDGQEKLQTLQDMMNGKQTHAKTPNKNSSARPHPYASQPSYTSQPSYASQPSYTSQPSYASQPVHASENHVFPLIDILKKDGKIIVLIDLPGVNKEDVQLMVNKEYLIVKGVPKSKVKESEVEIVLCERNHGPFERHIMLPEPTDGSNITAKFHNGVLQVSYPSLAQTGDVIPID